MIRVTRKLTLVHCTTFFFNDTATTEIYTLSLHDALPICPGVIHAPVDDHFPFILAGDGIDGVFTCLHLLTAHHHVIGKLDRKSTRLNSSHANISYAVFCLKKTSEIHQLQSILYRIMLSHK